MHNDLAIAILQEHVTLLLLYAIAVQTVFENMNTLLTNSFPII